jgi:hypothetical protein
LQKRGKTLDKRKTKEQVRPKKWKKLEDRQKLKENSNKTAIDDNETIEDQQYNLLFN